MREGIFGISLGERREESLGEKSECVLGTNLGEMEALILGERRDRKWRIFLWGDGLEEGMRKGVFVICLQ